MYIIARLSSSFTSKSFVSFPLHSLADQEEEWRTDGVGGGLRVFSYRVATAVLVSWRTEIPSRPFPTHTSAPPPALAKAITSRPRTVWSFSFVYDARLQPIQPPPPARARPRITHLRPTLVRARVLLKTNECVHPSAFKGWNTSPSWSSSTWGTTSSPRWPPRALSASTVPSSCCGWRATPSRNTLATGRP